MCHPYPIEHRLHGKASSCRSNLKIGKALFYSNFVFYKIMPINLKCASEEKYNEVMLRKQNCGKILNVLTKWQVSKRENSPSPFSRKGGSS